MGRQSRGDSTTRAEDTLASLDAALWGPFLKSCSDEEIQERRWTYFTRNLDRGCAAWLSGPLEFLTGVREPLINSRFITVNN